MTATYVDFSGFTTDANATTSDGPWSEVLGTVLPKYTAASGYNGRPRGMYCAQTASTQSQVVHPEFLSDQEELWLRLWLRCSAVAAGNARFFETRSDANLTPTHMFRMTTGQKIDILDHSGTNRGATTTAYPTNAWFSVSLYIKAGFSANGGTCSARLHLTPDSAAASYAEQLDASAGGVWGGTGPEMRDWRLGLRTSSSFTWGLDIGLVGWSQTGWVEPPSAGSGLPFYVGSTQASALRVGTATPTKVYRGATQVWP